MRGARCKALRRAFLAEHGRPPARMRWLEWPRRYVTSEWRRLKQAYKAAARART